MADIVDTLVLSDEVAHYIVRITNESDGTGEAGVVKVNKSDLTDVNGNEPDALDLMEVQYGVSGFNYITLHWDHTTDDVIAVLSGNGYFDWHRFGGLRDPRSVGGTGDILLTTDGPANGDSYDITLLFNKRRSP